MLRNVSWESYGWFVLFAVAAYYTVIICLYYFNELKLILSGQSSLISMSFISKGILKRNKRDSKQTGNVGLNDAPLLQADFSSVLDSITAEIRTAIQSATSNSWEKGELIYSLQKIAQKYSSINTDNNRAVIESYTLAACSDNSSITLEESDVKMMWLG